MQNKYPYQDCFGNYFRVESAQKRYSQAAPHEWVVFAEQQDEFGVYESEADSVDDCDTEMEAVLEWQRRQQCVREVFEAENKTPN